MTTMQKHFANYSLKNRAEHETYEKGFVLIKCDYCNKKFFFGSENHRLHLIWYHNKYMTPCESKEVHKLFLQTFWGFKLRPVSRRMKNNYRNKIKFIEHNLFEIITHNTYRKRVDGKITYVRKWYNHKSRLVHWFESIEKS